MKLNRARNEVRIIAGQWRGRRLPVITADGLRPTGDRVRETVFNWLMPYLTGTRCLDLFAGTGALGLEALSRGAGTATLVDTNPQAIEAIRVTTEQWPGIERATLVLADAQSWLDQAEGPYDVIFIDPPFGLISPMGPLEQLLDHALIADGGWVYLECAKGSAPDIADLPSPFSIIRHKVMGQVEAVLVRYHKEPKARDRLEGL